jgi:hypothetical protein
MYFKYAKICFKVVCPPLFRFTLSHISCNFDGSFGRSYTRNANMKSHYERSGNLTAVLIKFKSS